ncbi:MAG TPA: hypothetical protein VFV73_12580 [Streptosporangiaceae bacterium]|nr:hypothetical protein [Streptosporangiaceae bacterium]
MRTLTAISAPALGSGLKSPLPLKLGSRTEPSSIDDGFWPLTLGRLPQPEVARPLWRNLPRTQEYRTGPRLVTQIAH